MAASRGGADASGFESKAVLRILADWGGHGKPQL
jgi:hypothetical protein